MPGFSRRLASECSTIFNCGPVQTPAIASQQHSGDSSNLYSALVAVVQPGIGGDMIVYSAKNDPSVEGLMKYLLGCLAVPGSSTAAEVEVFVDCHRVICLTAVFDYRNWGQNTGLPSATNSCVEYHVACLMGSAGRWIEGQQLLPWLLPFIPQVVWGGVWHA